MATLIEAGDRDGALQAFFREIVRMPEEELAAYRANPVWPVRVAAVHTSLREIEAEGSPAASLDALGGVEIPVLQVLGGASAAPFGEAVRGLDARLPNGRVVAIEGARHAAHHTHVGEFVAAIRAFLEDVHRLTADARTRPARLDRRRVPRRRALRRGRRRSDRPWLPAERRRRCYRRRARRLARDADGAGRGDRAPRRDRRRGAWLDRRPRHPRGPRAAVTELMTAGPRNRPFRRGVPSPVIIETDGLAKRYGRIDALVDLSMQVDAGEVFGFLGPNGAGKTTAVKLLLGLARPSGGRGNVLGAPLGDRGGSPAGRLPAGAVPLPAVAAGARGARRCTRGSAAAGDRSKATFDRVLDEVGLPTAPTTSSETSRRACNSGSGSASRCSAIAGLVVLDEPTSALDPVGRADVRAIIRRVSDAGATVFLNSHLLTEVERVCDRVAIVDHGRVLASGRLDDLLGEPAVRIHATSLSPEAAAGLARFGRVLAAEDDDWLTIAGLDRRRDPRVVAAIVAPAASVHAVEPGRATLEERYLELIGRAGVGGDVAGPEAGTS